MPNCREFQYNHGYIYFTKQIFVCWYSTQKNISLISDEHSLVPIPLTACLTHDNLLPLRRCAHCVIHVAKWRWWKWAVIMDYWYWRSFSCYSRLLFAIRMRILLSRCAKTPTWRWNVCLEWSNSCKCAPLIYFMKTWQQYKVFLISSCADMPCSQHW